MTQIRTERGVSRTRVVLASVLAFCVGLFSVPTLVAAQSVVQTRAFQTGSLVVDVRSASRTQLSALMPLAAGSAVFRISNPSAVLVCVGGSDVNMTITVGGKCYPLCAGGATCADAAISYQTGINQVWLQAAVDHTAVFVAWGGWQ